MAALKLVVPAWLAVRVQVPTVSRLTLAPPATLATVQIVGVVVLTVTAKLLVAVAGAKNTVGGLMVPTARLAIAAKVMVCAPLVTTTFLVICGAAL